MSPGLRGAHHDPEAKITLTELPDIENASLAIGNAVTIVATVATVLPTPAAIPRSPSSMSSA
jgi:hypothetical protein